MTDQPIEGDARVVTPLKYGRREVVTVEQARRDLYSLSRAQHHVRKGLNRTADSADVVEVPGTRRGEWEYRESFLAVDPWEVAAYVGDLRGRMAVDASDRFLAELATAIRRGTPLMFDPPAPPTDRSTTNEV